MKIVHIAQKEDFESQMAGKQSYKQKGDFTHAATANSILDIWQQVKDIYTDPVIIEMDDMDPNLDVRYEKDPKTQIEYPHIYGPIPQKSVIKAVPADEWLEERKSRHVLLNTSMIDEKWIFPWLKKWISPKDRVCVMAMSYFDDTKNEADWNRQFSPADGCWYKAYQDVFYKYGLKPGQIVWINPWKDSVSQMQSKILNSSILMLPCGAPELFMKRIKKNRLKKIMKNYSGLMIGVSAGAMIQLGAYHISPDSDYPQFLLENGLGLLPDFDVECHYEGNRVQKESIELAMEKLNLPVYAIFEDGALTVDENKKIQLYGRAEVFEPVKIH